MICDGDNIVKLFFIKSLRKKSFYYFSCIIIICMSFLLVLGLIYYFISNTIIESRAFEIGREVKIITFDKYEDVIFKLKNIDYINNIYKSISPVKIDIKFDEKIVNCNISSSYYDNIRINNSRIIEFNKEKDILVPNKLRLNSEFYNLIKNKDIYLYLDSTIYKKVTNYYDYNNIIENYVFIPYDDFIEKFYHYYSNNIDGYQYTIVVNDISNINNVIDFLQEKGYDDILYDASLQNEIKILNRLQFVIKSAIISLYVLLFIVFYLIISCLLNDEIIDIAILKSLGYCNKKIFKIYFDNSFVIITIAYIVSLNIIFILKLFLKNYLIKNLNINVIVDSKILLGILCLYIITLILCLISNLMLIKKIKNISPILLFNYM